MALNSIQICNMALSHLGLPRISSFAESTKAAQECDLMFENIRDATLRAFPWTFARKVVKLSLLSDEDPPDYDFAYAYPSDCLYALEFYMGGKQQPIWEVRAQTLCPGKMIVTDHEDATLIYTARITDPAYFDPLFAKAFSYHLASELAQPLTKRTNIQEAMLQVYDRVLASARAVDANEGWADDSFSSDFLEARS